jgi:6-phospho-beta-glucosidase
MGMRSIPVLLAYIGQMRSLCPQAWLINFANPSGMLTEAATRVGGWARTVGICDAPSQMHRIAAAAIAILAGKDARPEQVDFDYFGLNHLGWVRSVRYQGQDYQPELIDLIRSMGGLPGFPFDPELIAALGLIPNEYLYYYYSAPSAVRNILRAETSRGEEIAGLNGQLFTDLRRLKDAGDPQGMLRRYDEYLNRRGSTYMAAETGQAHSSAALDPRLAEAYGGEGYAGVALDLVEGLSGARPKVMTLNVPNQGAIHGMGEAEVVEIPALVSAGGVQPLAVGEIPGHSLGLMKTVKAYERLTVEAATEGSFAKALLALTLHPLVADRELARRILAGYQAGHGELFPALA